MQLQFTIEEGEYIEAGRLWAKEKGRRRYDSYMTSWRGIALLLLLLLTGLLIAQAKGAVAAWILISLGSIYALSIGIRVLMCPRILRKNYEEQKSSMSVRLLIEEDRVESERADGAAFGRLSWDAFIRFLEGPRTIALYTSPWQFIAIPKRAMTSEQHHELLATLNLKIPVKEDATWK